MPTPRTWLPRAQEILGVLDRMSTSLLDREAVENLFEIQRRAAILLMRDVGPIKQGVSFRVERQHLMDWVRKIADAGSGELRRRQTQLDELSQGLLEAQAMRHMLKVEGRPPVPFPIVAEVLQASFDSLPAGIAIGPGSICVQFSSDDPSEACRLLYALALANDFGGFLSTQHAESAASSQESVPDKASDSCGECYQRG